MYIAKSDPKRGEAVAAALAGEAESARLAREAFETARRFDKMGQSGRAMQFYSLVAEGRSALAKDAKKRLRELENRGP